MPIPESQLETWAHQGSITQSSNTYNSIKSVLKADTTPYAKNHFDIFLQGSYGNDTNIYSESDVDIIIRLDDCMFSDLNALPEEQKQAYRRTFSKASYTLTTFKQDVLSVLTTKYGSAVQAGAKAITIEAGGSRRKADLIVSCQYRRYAHFRSISDSAYTSGICFFNSQGERIANYPKQHSVNLTAKHQMTSQWLKPTVRIFKNIRSKLVTEKMLSDGVAPSYYLEGLLYNVPNEKFGGSYEDTIVNTINWIMESDRNKFVCANEQYYLLYEGSPVTWRAEKCEAFLNALIELWKQW